jgi:hypothetical protein
MSYARMSVYRRARPGQLVRFPLHWAFLYKVQFNNAETTTTRPSVRLWQDIINYTVFHIFTRLYTEVLYITRDRAWLDFCVNRLIEGRNLFEDLLVLSMFLDRFMWNLAQHVCTKSNWENARSVEVGGAKVMCHWRAWTNCCSYILTLFC